MDGGADAGPAGDAGPGLDAASTDGAPPDGGDAGADPASLDSDGDTISDADEGNGLVDTDGDGIPDHLDLDSDGDGIPDAVEAGDADLTTPPVDTDGDGTPDFRDLDSDGDFIADADEGAGDFDLDGIPNFRDFDADGDGIFDSEEAGDLNLATPPVDTDGDRAPDFLDLDADGDFIADVHEGAGDFDGDGVPDFRDLDSDGDTVPDAIEAGDQDLTTAPVDTDGDGFPDFRDVDSDGDGLLDGIEAGCPASTERTAADSDQDGFLDPAEIAYGSDPCDPASGIDDFYFVLPPGGPTQTATLTFTNTEIDRADLAIAIDTTGSMADEIANLQLGLSTTIIPGVRANINDVSVSVSSFEDFPVAPFGSAAAADRPFRLGSRVSSDASAAQAAVNGLVLRNGGDFPESAHAALYHIATGTGLPWMGGTVPAFDPMAGRVPGVADGTIGGVGFRSGSLPIIVLITDAVSHTWRDYLPAIQTATTGKVRDALVGIGGRVVGVSGLGRPFSELLCTGAIAPFFGAIDPGGGDVDWFALQGAVAGDVVQLDVAAQGFDSRLDPVAAIANANGFLAVNDNLGPGVVDSRALATLSGPGPYYVAVSASGDGTFTGAGQNSSGHYVATVRVNTATGFFAPATTACRAQDGASRTSATTIVPIAQTSAPSDVGRCRADCDRILGAVHPLFADFTFPYDIAEQTGASVPPCAWSAFGPRPAGCTPAQCCTGQGGAGQVPSAAGSCPLSFEISSTGAGLDVATVTGIEALVRFSTFDFTTVIRGDPALLPALDTACFVRRVVPVSAMRPGACGPTPVREDRRPPAGTFDTWAGAIPGTVLGFDVEARNDDGSGTPCVAAGPSPQLFRAYIDVLADGVTVVDTRDVIIIVPPGTVGAN